MNVDNCVINLCAWVIPVAYCHFSHPLSPLHLLDAALSWPGKTDLTISWYLHLAAVLTLSNAEKGGKERGIWSKETMWFGLFFFFFPFFPRDNHWFLLLRNARDTRTCCLMHMKGRFLFQWPWRLDVTMQDKYSQHLLDLLGEIKC